MKLLMRGEMTIDRERCKDAVNRTVDGLKGDIAC